MKARFALQRTDTGQYYKKTKSGYLKNWAPDDPRRKQWTPDIDEATLYSETGIRPIAGWHRNTSEKTGVTFVVVEVKMMVSGVRTDL